MRDSKVIEIPRFDDDAECKSMINLIKEYYNLDDSILRSSKVISDNRLEMVNRLIEQQDKDSSIHSNSVDRSIGIVGSPSCGMSLKKAVSELMINTIEIEDLISEENCRTDSFIKDSLNSLDKEKLILSELSHVTEHKRQKQSLESKFKVVMKGNRKHGNW